MEAVVLNRRVRVCGQIFLSWPGMTWSPYSCNDCKFSCFTRSIWNRYVDSFKTPLKHSDKHFMRLLQLIWRPGFTELL